ncbi:MAG: hypothetical protein ACYDBQ_10025 [Thermoplasmatota archaeon]
MDPTSRGRAPAALVWGTAAFLLAVVLGRFVLWGGAYWGLFALVLPAAFVVVALRTTWPIAVVVTLLFTAGILAIALFVRYTHLGWSTLLLLPAVALAGTLMVAVARQLLRPQQKKS